MPNSARDAAVAYLDTISADPDAQEDFLALFSDEVHFEDPVGGPVFEGHEGLRKFHAGLCRAWSELSMRPERIIERGKRAAVQWRAEGQSATGNEITFEGINTLKVDDAGKIASMEGYWEFEEVIGQM